jgi:hypothetical protein
MKQPLRRLICRASALTAVAASVVAGAQTLTDPTRPMSAPAAAEARTESSKLQLEAVLNRSGSYVAIVSGKLVHSGDRFGNITIQDISAAGVRYSQDGKTRFVAMPDTKLSVRHEPAVTKEIP